jgi:hypothetical protein
MISEIFNECVVDLRVIRSCEKSEVTLYIITFDHFLIGDHVINSGFKVYLIAPYKESERSERFGENAVENVEALSTEPRNGFGT